MSQRIGIDLVHIPKFSEKIKDSALLNRLFTDQELGQAAGSVEILAGMFAAKEAYFKAVRRVPEWHAVEVIHAQGGAPQLRGEGVEGSVSVSISHDGEYVIAVVIVIN